MYGKMEIKDILWGNMEIKDILCGKMGNKKHFMWKDEVKNILCMERWK